MYRHLPEVFLQEVEKVEDNRMNNIFGAGSKGGVQELSEISSDAWAPISAEPRRQTPPSRKPQTASHQAPSQKPGESKKAPPQKQTKKSGYVGAKTGLGKKKPPVPEGRISKGAADKKPTDKRKQNKTTASDNNIKRPPSRKPQGQRVEDVRQQTRRPQGQKAPERAKKSPSDKRERTSSLSKQQKNQMRKQQEIYERGRRQGKSKDEIRREQQRRQIKKRRRNSVLVFIVFVAVMAVGFGTYIYNNVALVKNITVEGSSTYTVKKIVKASGVIEGDRLLAVREKRVRELLTTELPYIKDASISYGFPDTLTITVTPTEDKLMISEKNKHLRLDRDGKVLSNAKTKMKDGLFKIEGLTYKKHEIGSTYVPTEGEESKYEMAQKIALEAEKAGLSNGTINVTDLQKITFTYDGRIRIYLGDAKDLAEKMEFASKTIAVAAPDKQTGYIDMRFSERGYFSEGSMDNT